MINNEINTHVVSTNKIIKRTTIHQSTLEIKRVRISKYGKDKNALFVWVNKRGSMEELKEMNFHAVLFGEKFPIKTKEKAENHMTNFLQREYGFKQVKY